MKNLFNEILFGKNAKLSGLIAIAVVGFIALGCGCGKDFDLSKFTNSGDTTTNSSSNDDTIKKTSEDLVPSESVVEALVKETTSLFKDAVNTGDFSIIHESSSSDFQSTYSVDEMKTAFKSYTDKKSVVVPILKKVDAADAEFTSPPSIRKEKSLSILTAQGKFPTKPYNVRFDYEYVMRDGEWKMLKLVINIP